VNTWTDELSDVLLNFKALSICCLFEASVVMLVIFGPNNWFELSKSDTPRVVEQQIASSHYTPSNNELTNTSDITHSTSNNGS
jgi:hypothetical protein